MKRLLAVLTLLLLIAAACGSDEADPVSAGGGEDGSELPVNDGDEPVSSDGPVNEPGDTDPPVDDEPLPVGPLGAGPYPIADLTVTYEHPDVGKVEYQIVCLGDTATLLGDIDGVRDQTACAALADPAVQTRLIDGAPTDVACTEIYGGPETARIVGTIGDKAVDTTVDRANGCGIDDWDRLLADLLPEPLPFA